MGVVFLVRLCNVKRRYYEAFFVQTAIMALYVLDKAWAMWCLDHEPLLVYIIVVMLTVAFLVRKWSVSDNLKAPTVAFYGQLLPSVFSRLRFNSSAPTVISAGYRKVLQHLQQQRKLLTGI